jgi:diaminohydroxyphosphoribosylaminopyrimidine deaminase/5-amino-6-(5-phosphoribosylamino)uracil reductase
MDATNLNALPITQSSFMRRAITLAHLGLGNTKTNPLVGCVIVYNNNIIGEGYHKQFGEAHAEVNAIKSVAKENLPLLKKATLYVTLEPCCHIGKTPPCTNIIIEHEIPHVVIACLDPFDAVKGKGVRILEQNGIKVTVGLLEKYAAFLNRRFLCNQVNKRPYIILKWAQSADGFLNSINNTQTKISGNEAQILLHKWRSEEDAFIIGKQTLLIDNPSLSNRFFPGKQPVRIVFANAEERFKKLLLFKQTPPAWIVGKNHQVKALPNALLISQDTNHLKETMQLLLTMGISSVVVEGGKKLLDSFIQSGLYDEFRVLKSKSFVIKNGLLAPQIPLCLFKSNQTFDLGADVYWEACV